MSWYRNQSYRNSSNNNYNFYHSNGFFSPSHGSSRNNNNNDMSRFQHSDHFDRNRRDERNSSSLSSRYNNHNFNSIRNFQTSPHFDRDRRKEHDSGSSNDRESQVSLPNRYSYSPVPPERERRREPDTSHRHERNDSFVNSNKWQNLTHYRMDNRPAWMVKEQNDTQNHNYAQKNMQESSKNYYEEENNQRRGSNATNVPQHENVSETEVMDLVAEESITTIIKNQVKDCEFNLLDNQLDYFASKNLDEVWIKYKNYAVAIAYQQIIDYMHEKDTHIEEDEVYESDESSDVVPSDEEEAYYEAYHNTGSNKRRKTSNWSYSEEEIFVFLKALTTNYVFDLGFHISSWHPDDEKYCWCPLHRQMEKWKEKHHLNYDPCNVKGKMAPSALLAHLSSKGDATEVTKSVCLLHLATEKYLRCLYRFYHRDKGPNEDIDEEDRSRPGHKHLYHTNSPEYNKSLLYEIEKKTKGRELLKKENEQLIAKTKQEEEKIKKMDGLEKVNKELAEKVKELVAMKKQLSLKISRKKELTKTQFQLYSEIIDSMFDSQHFLVQQLKVGYKTLDKQGAMVASGVNITIKQEVGQVSVEKHAFDLQQFFDEKYSLIKKNQDAFLFRKLKVDQTNLHYDHSWKFMTEWNIIFDTGFQYEEDPNDFVKAIDKGGPTRLFFSEVWKQMGQLKVTAGLKNEKYHVKLFEATSKGLSPCSDDVLKYKVGLMVKELSCKNQTENPKELEERLMKKVKGYYKALGRIMYLAMFTRNSIVETVMPMYYMNVIFRNMQPKDDEYELGVLLDDLFDGEDDVSVKSVIKNILKLKDDKQKFELLFKEIFDENEEGEKSEKEKELKEFILKELKSEDSNAKERATNLFAKVLLQRKFYDNKIIAINSIKQGLSLDNSTSITDQLHIIPPEAVKKSLFSKYKITADEIIEVLTPDYTHVIGNVKMYQECEHFFEVTLKDFIRQRAESDVEIKIVGSLYGDEFLTAFLAFVTGSYWISYKSDLVIKVEFNDNMDQDGMHFGRKALPVAHTCDKILKLPGKIYSNGEEFGSKLDKALSFCANSFGMG